MMMEEFVCYYRLKFAAKKNVTFHFNEFDLKGGSPGYCDSAIQYVKFSPDNQPATKYVKCAIDFLPCPKAKHVVLLLTSRIDGLLYYE